ncbi:MAG: hypothetical protein FWD53_08175, partial [Phycisphaerales bacterium]|nr:hypothetical protein [Phycisphaerales bacterium]
MIPRKTSYLLASGFWLLTAVPTFADPALDHAQRLLSQAIRESKDAPLNKNPDTANTIAALRMANDKELLPIFQKLRQSTAIENRIYGMISETVLTKDPSKIDLALLFAADDPALVGSAIATLIDSE